MSNIDKQSLRDNAESTIGILENIAGFEPSDIDGDAVELRFETEGGFDTGCDVSIVDQCQKAADVVRALLDELEAKDKSISFLKDQLAQLANFNPDWDKLEAATDSLREHMAELTAARARIAELEAREVREERNQFLVVRYPGKSPVIKHCTGDLEEFLRQLLKQDNLATIDIVTHRYYGVGGQWVQDADEYLYMMDSAGRINGEG
ncbi:hypothetical protein C3433_13385 [Citrobacter freundii]|nr:hypothetical protein C3433_13385 [Citrobacter freundii]